jgi:hypothetical protein
MKYILSLLLTISIFGCSVFKHKKENLPLKISNIPYGIEVKHNIKKAYASSNEDYPNRGGKYKWKYKTSVTSKKNDLKIIEFGTYVFENNKWIERTIYNRPFNNEEFSEWYKCPQGVIKKGITYSDTSNWTTSMTVTTEDSKNLWYYIGIDSDNKKYVGYSEIKLIGEIKE